MLYAPVAQLDSLSHVAFLSHVALAEWEAECSISCWSVSDACALVNRIRNSEDRADASARITGGRRHRRHPRGARTVDHGASCVATMPSQYHP